MSEQKKECSCASGDLLVKTLEAMSELTKAMCEQNKLMAQIVDQNNQLIDRFDVAGGDETMSFIGNLDDDYA